MDLWYMEQHTPNVKFSVKVDKQLYSGMSDFQRIDVFESAEFGRILTLDGFLMLTEKDEFIYHEMIVHVPMCVHPYPKKVLVIGGGDGGAVRELLRYPGIEAIDLVEIDEAVVEVSKKYLPGVASGFSDSRVKCHYKDDAYAMQRAHKRIVQSFPYSRVYQAHITTYPSGHWLFGFASKKYHPVRDADWDRWKKLGIKTRYYNTNLHAGAFALPTYVEELLKDVESEC